MRLRHQEWNIQSPIQRRPVHKRRQKKKSFSKMLPPIKNIASQVDHSCPQTASATTKSNTYNQRHRRPVTMFKFAWFMLTITQLLCDMAQVESSKRLLGLLASGVELKASSDLDTASSEPALAGPFEVVDENWRQQRFLAEPRDAFAVVGQPEVSFSCLIYAQHGAGSWKRSSRRQLSAWNLNILDDEEKVWTTLEKLPLLSQRSDRNNSAQLLISGQTISRSDDELNATKYTLHIRNVTLANDDHYQCMVAAADLKTQPELKSRQARLSVVKAPGRMELRLTRSSANDGTEIDIGQLIPHDTPSSNNALENSITTLVDGHRQPNSVRVVQLEDGERLRLECRTSQSKPRAQIVWLDSDSSKPIDDETRKSLELTVETHFELESNQLERTISTITLEVDRNKHHEKLFACSTQHLAYELASNGSLPESVAANLQPLKQMVKISVVYKPRVTLVKNQNNPTEGDPVKFTCVSDARPELVNYSWFVDEQQIEGAHEPDLFIGSITRQMHLRQIKCVASNVLGSGSDTMKLAVKYSPAYVTHLLPLSLQPDYSGTTAALVQHQPENGNNPREQQYSFLDPSDQSVSREMAIGVPDGKPITLRCDFDSYPELPKIQWFKIATDYNTMNEVTSAEADDLVAYGANYLQFKGRAREMHRKGHSAIYYDAVQIQVRPTRAALVSSDNHGNKRHIIIEDAQDLGFGSTLREENTPQDEDQMDSQFKTRSVSSDEPNRNQLPKSYAIDFDRMSHNLILELNRLRAQNASNQKANLDGTTSVPLVKMLDGEPTSHSKVHKIYEPLAFFMHRHQQLFDPNQSSSKLSNNVREFAGQRFAELVLLDRIQVEPAESSSSPKSNKTLLQSGVRKRPSEKRLSRPLLERQAYMTTSSLPLARVTAESIGRYVCLAKAADGLQDHARAVFIVVAQSPRIVSERIQTAPLGAPQLQIECLAQINAVHNNKTHIRWFKDGKLLEQSSNSPRNISLNWEVSPDALYVRSKLTINGAQNSDFGFYICNISNSLGTDSMQIKLEATATTGFIFQILLYVTPTLVIVFVVIITIMLIVILSKRSSRTTGNGKPSSALAILKGDGKKVAVVLAANTEQGGKLVPTDSRPPPPPPPPLPNSDRSSSSPSGHSNHSAAKRSINSSEASTTITRQLLDVELEAMAQSQQHAMLMMQNGQTADLNQTLAEQRRQQIVRTGSALGSSGVCCLDNGQGQHYSNSMRGRFARTSLRSDHQTTETKLDRSRNATLNLGQTPANHDKFAAIHETLVHKLHFGGAGGAVNLMATPPNNNFEHDQRPDGDLSPTKPAEDLKQIKSSASFVDRIRNRFKAPATPTPANQLKSRHSSLGRDSGKGRPTISMPIGSAVSGARRLSLSNSLTLVNDKNQTRPAALPASSSVNQQSKSSIKMQLNHIGGGVESSLVSSKANLIQDSGTASDGTTSSGRSSITSNNPNGQLHRQPMAGKLMGPHQDQAYCVEQMNLAYIQQQLWANGTGQFGASNCDENILYANSSNLYDLANDQQLQLYHQQAIDPNSMLGSYGQMPVLMSEPYLAAATAAAALGESVQQQDATRPCYATICNEVNKSPLGQQEQYHTSHNGYSQDGLASYGTQPARVHFEHHQQPISMTSSNSPNPMQNPHLEQQQAIVCSVSDEAAFESHYGTLLSRSSAYKTLGYDQLPQKQFNYQ